MISLYRKIKKFLPECIRCEISSMAGNFRNSKEITGFISKQSNETSTKEENEIIQYLTDNSWLKSCKNRAVYKSYYTYVPRLFPYAWILEYMSKEINIGRDSGGRYYIIDDGKRLYPQYKNTTKKEAERFARTCGVEMDIRSPHRYVTHENYLFGTLPVPPSGDESGFFVEEGDVVADVECAEGNFALSVIDAASHVYLFECEPSWIKALELTFKPYRHKVTIVNKYVSDHDSDTTVKLDTFFKDKRVNFIKADIEGAEAEMLRGAQSLLRERDDIKLSICTYHKAEDARDFKVFLEKLGYQTAYTKGLVILDRELRKAIIRGRKERQNKIIPNEGPHET